MAAAFGNSFTEAFSYLAAVKQTALRALENPNCQKLFGTGLDPAAVFSTLYSNVGTFFPVATKINGIPVSAAFAWDPVLLGYDAGEFNRVPVMGLDNGVPYAGLGIEVLIAVNNWNASGRIGDTNVPAAILLHELGHVLADLGNQGVQIKNDNGDSDLSQKNTETILKDCDLTVN